MISDAEQRTAWQSCHKTSSKAKGGSARDDRTLPFIRPIPGKPSHTMLQANLLVLWRCMHLVPAQGTSKGPLRGVAFAHASAPSSIVPPLFIIIIIQQARRYEKNVCGFSADHHGCHIPRLLLHGRSRERMWSRAQTGEQCSMQGRRSIGHEVCCMEAVRRLLHQNPGINAPCET